jgi:holo-[acyl-carrier protein] synthase
LNSKGGQIDSAAAAAPAAAASASQAPAGASAPAPIEDGVGLGVDIVDIARMKRVLERSPRFAERVFTEGERAYCEATAAPHVHYATRFAAKEAVLKALGTGFSHGIAPADVEVVRPKNGRPAAKLHRRAREVARELGVRELPISLSYTHTDAVACAMAITDDSVRATEARTDPMEELARQFKETRSLLDEIPARGPKEEA